jgi:general secretion pathway protein K
MNFLRPISGRTRCPMVFKRMVIGSRPSNRGMAVVMALSVILIMAATALELHKSERDNMLDAAAMRDRVTLEQMTSSGIHLAMAVLIKDRLESETDSLQEDWADEETLKAYLAEIPFDRGTLNVKITDELGKIQINALVRFPEGNQFNEKQRRIWERLSDNLLSVMELMADQSTDLEETDPQTIINSVKDWLDKDDDLITGLSGAESDYYETLDPPYACKNAPFDHISEVRLVKGITPELFRGLAGVAGLEDYITVYGAEEQNNETFSFPGKININTAKLPVLTVLLPPESDDLANLLIDYRSAVSGTKYTNDLTHINWYKNIPGFAGITLDPELVSISSSVFRIVATADLEGSRSTTTAIIRRERENASAHWQCKVLNWKTE